MLILKNMMNISLVSLIFLGSAIAKPVEEGSHNSNFRAQIIKDRTTNVEKKLTRLVNALEECNPPDGSHNFPQMLSESDTQDEMDTLDPQIEEVDSHVNETFDLGATPAHFQMSTPPLIIKPNFISSTTEEQKPAPQDTHDPTNEGASKGGRHKGQHLHQQRGGSVHLIPIIRMGEYSEESKGLTVIKPWNS